MNRKHLREQVNMPAPVRVPIERTKAQIIAEANIELCKAQAQNVYIFTEEYPCAYVQGGVQGDAWLKEADEWQRHLVGDVVYGLTKRDCEILTMHLQHLGGSVGAETRKLIDDIKNAAAREAK